MTLGRSFDPGIISNNTAPDGTTIKTLQGLTTLSNEFTENSGIILCNHELEVGKG